MPSQPWALQEIILGDKPTTVLIGVYTSLVRAKRAAPFETREYWHKITADSIFHAAKHPTEEKYYRIIKCPWDKKIPYEKESK